MPRHSHRQIKLRSLEKQFTLWMKFRLALHRNKPRVIDIQFSDSESESNSSDSSDNSTISIEQDPPIVQDIIQEYLEISNNHYLSKSRHERLNNDWWQFAFTHFTPRQFRTCFRMNKSSFIAILDAIQQHDIFQNESSCPQKSIGLQLMVIIYHFYGQSRVYTAHQFSLAVIVWRALCGKMSNGRRANNLV